MPLKMEQYERSLGQPPLCEQLKVRDLTDDLLIQLNGSFVAGYKISGIHTYYASDEERNRTKLALEALIRSLPERSMRLQARFEIAEGDGGIIARYNREQQNPNAVLQAVDREQSDAWLKKNTDGYYLQHMLHFYFIWDPRIHHQSTQPDHCGSHFTPGLQSAGSGTSGTDSRRPPSARAARHRAYERRTRDSGDTGTEAFLLFQPPGSG
jgi:hypothetical protein